jgi:hypothetical protein
VMRVTRHWFLTATVLEAKRPMVGVPNAEQRRLASPKPMDVKSGFPRSRVKRVGELFTSSPSVSWERRCMKNLGDQEA